MEAPEQQQPITHQSEDLTIVTIRLRTHQYWQLMATQAIDGKVSVKRIKNIECIATVLCSGSSCQVLCLGETSFDHVTSELCSSIYFSCMHIQHQVCNLYIVK